MNFSEDFWLISVSLLIEKIRFTFIVIYYIFNLRKDKIEETKLIVEKAKRFLQKNGFPYEICFWTRTRITKKSSQDFKYGKEAKFLPNVPYEEYKMRQYDEIADALEKAVEN